MLTKLNYQPSRSHARQNNLHCVDQQVMDNKSVWGFSELPIGAQKIYFELGEQSISWSSSKKEA